MNAADHTNKSESLSLIYDVCLLDAHNSSTLQEQCVTWGDVTDVSTESGTDWRVWLEVISFISQ